MERGGKEKHTSMSNLQRAMGFSIAVWGLAMGAPETARTLVRARKKEVVNFMMGFLESEVS